MLKNLLYKLVRKGLSYTRELQDGKVEVTGWVKGIDQVDFEGNNAVLEFSNFNGNVKVGYATTFGIHNLVHGDVEIGRYCQFGPYASVNTYNHPAHHITTYINKRLLNGKMTAYKSSQPTRIGNDVWVGKNAQILGGITVGNGAVIAAGAVVTKDVPDYHIVAGVPARIVKPRFSERVIQELQQLAWWDKSEEEIKKLEPLFEKDLTKVDSIYE